MRIRESKEYKDVMNKLLAKRQKRIKDKSTKHKVIEGDFSLVEVKNASAKVVGSAIVKKGKIVSSKSIESINKEMEAKHVKKQF
ncbi:MAG: hypothetical protein ACXADH_12970 [Candidatus Kariarchaeaceae archaeon]|jgi:hypothetical protein